VLLRLSDPLGHEREQHVKALFRRGRALMQTSEFERARQDLRQANQLDPSSRQARAAVACPRPRTGVLPSAFRAWQVRELWQQLRERE
jgi:Tfp pilus assembly protein PilF